MPSSSVRHGPSWRTTSKPSDAAQSSTISPSSIRLITIPQILIGRPRLWPSATQARRDPVALGHLVLHANAQVTVTEDELVNAERPPDPVVARVVTSVDVCASTPFT